MDNELNRVDSHRVVRLAEKFHNKEYRDAYVESHTRRFLAHQMRKFRGEKSQVEFGEILNKRQTVVWRLEDPNYSGWSLRTLFQVAQKLNVAAVARFVDFQTFLRFTNDTSKGALNPRSYDEARVDAAFATAAWEQPAHQSLYVNPWQTNQGTIGIVGFYNALGVPLYAGQTSQDAKLELRNELGARNQEIAKDQEIARLKTENTKLKRELLTCKPKSRDQMWPDFVDPQLITGFGQQPSGRAI